MYIKLVKEWIVGENASSGNVCGPAELLKKQQGHQVEIQGRALRRESDVCADEKQSESRPGGEPRTEAAELGDANDFENYDANLRNGGVGLWALGVDALGRQNVHFLQHGHVSGLLQHTEQGQECEPQQSEGPLGEQ